VIEQFRRPPREYGILPFWFLNGKLQLRVFNTPVNLLEGRPRRSGLAGPPRLVPAFDLPLPADNPIRIEV
jgi:hypothetical protein